MGWCSVWSRSWSGSWSRCGVDEGLHHVSLAVLESSGGFTVIVFDLVPEVFEALVIVTAKHLNGCVVLLDGESVSASVCSHLFLSASTALVVPSTAVS